MTRKSWYAVKQNNQPTNSCTETLTSTGIYIHIYYAYMHTQTKTIVFTHMHYCTKIWTHKRRASSVRKEPPRWLKSFVLFMKVALIIEFNCDQQTNSSLRSHFTDLTSFNRSGMVSFFDRLTTTITKNPSKSRISFSMFYSHKITQKNISNPTYARKGLPTSTLYNKNIDVVEISLSRPEGRKRVWLSCADLYATFVTQPNDH